MNIILLFTVGGCAATKTICPCDAPETIVVEGKEIVINAEVNRREIDGKGMLNIQVWLTTTDKSIFPSNLIVEGYYIRPSDLSHDAFEGNFENQVADLENGIWALETSVGPDWKKGEPIDIAVRMTNPKGKTLFIKKDKVEIK